MGLFKKIGNALRKTREAIARKIDSLLSHGELDDDFYDELTDILISCDIGARLSMEIVDSLRERARKGKIRKAEDVKTELKNLLKEDFAQVEPIDIQYPAIITIVGVNGVGKTTTIGKLSQYFKNNKKDVTLVAGDTFRAAASNQLNEWANRTKTRIIKHAEGADAAAVVYDGITSAKAKGTDVLLVDTAGRLHTKTNLMEELKKIDKVINREYPEANRYTFIVLDATTGQNALNQINAFNEFVEIDGIVLTKLDGTAKGGVIIAIQKDYGLPVAFVGVGEGVDDLEEFDYNDFVDNLF
ncbi:MAG: signal recognition particle-docking protein FtsY [Clostridia bacterium]|nr:signal recognition particle-docking protein FtsY [Clostridia bacterium]MBQ8792434.1 signal recognition particle-docking protein FtsY [Clostridia bacterium]